MDITGNFETHFTLRTADAQAVIDWVASREMKLTHIVLHGGSHASQPMITRHSTGRLADSILEAREITRQLVSLGAEVLRVKIEVEVGNPAAPADEHEAAGCPSEWYFEHHVKLLLHPEQDLAPLVRLADRHEARLSRNALRVRADLFEERFLTQRLYRQGRDAATKALDQLQDALKQNTFTILECEAEYVIFDSNVALDSGWIDQPLT